MSRGTIRGAAARRLLALTLTLAGASGCGGGSEGAFRHQFADNRSEDMAAVLERLPDARPQDRPENALGEALVVVATHGEDGQRQVVALTPAGEQRWSQAIDTARGEASAAVGDGDYEAAMRAMAKLRPYVDAFFDKVTVNVAMADRRENRLMLLNEIREATRAVAYFSKIEG